MKDVLMYMGLFVVGYVLIMGLLFVVLRLIFPSRAAEADEDLVAMMKYSRIKINKKAPGSRKMKTING